MKNQKKLVDFRDNHEITMECKGRRVVNSEKKKKYRELWRNQHTERKRDRPEDGMTSKACARRQWMKSDDYQRGAAYLTTNNSSGRRAFWLLKFLRRTHTQWCYLTKISVFVSIGVCVYMCFFIEISGSMFATASHGTPFAPLDKPMPASSMVCGGADINCVHAGDERRRDNEVGSAPVSSDHCCAGTEESAYAAESSQNNIIVQASARSKLAGEGFHRSMLTTVHIKTRIADKHEVRVKDTEEKTRMFEKSYSEHAEGDNRKPKKERENTLGLPRGRGAETEASTVTGKDANERHVFEDERKVVEDVSDRTRRGQQHKLDSLEADIDARRGKDVSARKRAREGTATVGDNKTVNSEGKEFGRRREDAAPFIQENPEEEYDHIICTVTCEYALDKVVYVDPDQTWELGLKGHFPLAAHATGDKSLDTHSSTESAQMGSVEVFPPAVDFEAPVFAPRLPSLLHVRQTVGDVVLKRLALDGEAKPCRSGDVRLSVNEKKMTSSKIDRSAVSEVPSRTFTESIFAGERHLLSGRETGGHRAVYHNPPKRVADQALDVHAVTGTKGCGETDANQVAEKSGENNSCRASGCEEGVNACPTVEDNENGDSGQDILASRGSEENKSPYYSEATVTLELPFHHRYDAACSDCEGISVHHIEAPVVKVVCCRGRGTAEGYAGLRSERNDFPHKAGSKGNRGNSRDDIHKAAVVEDEKFESQRNSGTTAAARDSPSHETHWCSHCTSLHIKATTGVKYGQSRSDRPSSNTIMHSGNCSPRSHERLAPNQAVTINTCATDLHTDAKTRHHRRAQTNQEAAEENIDEEDGRTDRCAHDSKTTRGSAETDTSFMLEVPVGLSGDLPWVTAMTLAAVAISLLATAWFLGYAEAQNACCEQ